MVLISGPEPQRSIFEDLRGRSCITITVHPY
jgi:hypothetical protein